ncbi:phage major capsid protein [Micromonospora sp. PSH03]|uniref:phage major capsid protein n=1 Tax=Micromonospora salmantinae TaxID=2911211 RepID=UPI001EE85C0B|nr:phage major capsid protein [Micromonospora salmantinae]MCG5459626.1 phage major capsid protein [Micromonospora salmantinae]
MDFAEIAKKALERRATLVTEMRAVDADATLGASEKSERIEKIDGDIRQLETEASTAIERGEREARASELAERAGKLVTPRDRSERSDGGVGAELRAVALGESRGFDLVTSGDFDTRAAAGANTAVLTNTAWAGTTVQNKFVAEILESLTESSPILQAGVRIVSTTSGEKMEWPVKNGKLIAAQVAEGVVYPRSKGSFTRWSIDSYKYGVIAEATAEMLKDSALPLESIVAGDLGEAIADATNLDFLKGAGTAGPHGIVPATVLTQAATSATVVNYDDLIKMEHAIKPKYRTRAKWYASDDFALKARLVKDLEGRYMWQDAVTAGAPSLFFGKPVILDTFMDSYAISKNPVIFGDFSKFLVRFVGSVNISRSDEYGWDADVVAWKANVRVDSGLTDAAALVKMVTPAA